LFCHQLHHWREEVAQRQPCLFIQAVHQAFKSQIGQTSVAQKLANVGEVFLLHIGLIVLFVGSRARPIDAATSSQQVGLDNLVEELASIVAIQPEQFKGHLLFDAIQPDRLPQRAASSVHPL